jgi:hypothetical protein
MCAMNPKLLRPLASGFNPKSIAGLFQWFDGSDRATLFDATSGGSAVADDGSVARWEDKSGNGYHLTQGTAGNRPTLRAAIRNGRSVLEYDGANSALVSASITNNLSELSVFSVWNADTLGGSNIGHIWTTSGGFGVTTVRRFRLNPGDSAQLDAGSSGGNTGGLSFAQDVFNRLHAFWNGGTDRVADFEFLINGTAAPSNTSPGTTTIANTGAATYAVGATTAGSFNFDGYIAEVLVYTRYLSVSERTKIDNWLKTKWGF